MFINNVLKFPCKLPKSIYGGNMKQVLRVRRISKKQLDKLNAMGYTVILI